MNVPSAPNLRLIASAGLEDRAIRSVVLVGDYPPRRCGIATFTADVREALISARPDVEVKVAALDDRKAHYAYPSEVAYRINQDEPADYRTAAAAINADAPDVVCVQHEFGIFGGPAGEHLMLLLDAVDAPVVATLHTVLEQPDDDQRRVFEKLIARSSRLIVMAERGRDMLLDVWKVPAAKIALVPHGAPDAPLEPTARAKAALGYAGKELLFTFGLLSPNKGIECAIRALPEIVRARPDALYLVLGATHPHLIAREGEAYRESLQALAEELGVGEHLQLLDSYTDTPKLIEYLNAADVYVTPYLNKQQITSGTLSYAAALGKPIVSTPYWHAEELLADDLGVIVPFRDPDAIAGAVVDLLSHDDERRALRKRIYAATRETVWSVFGARYLDIFAAGRAAEEAERRRPKAVERRARIAEPSLAGVRRMTDSCGMLQHSVFSLPDRRHGYCVDDNARALILMHRWPSGDEAERKALTTTYASFVQYAWNDDEGAFRNFMNYEREWLEDKGSEDSIGRSFWSVAVTAAEAEHLEHRRWARHLLGRIQPQMAKLTSPRTAAFVILGLCALADAGMADEAQLTLLRVKAELLVELYEVNRAQGHDWFEAYLSYDNARLPEALLRAGRTLGEPEFVACGLHTLEKLCGWQTSPAGLFRPVPTCAFGEVAGAAGKFDQQPLEAVATIDACAAAVAAGAPRRHWVAEADKAYDWYFGANDLGASLADAGAGECFDGLTWTGPNLNQGAESVLSLQLAVCAWRALTITTGTRLKTAHDS
ncbi:MAG: glycosyltransferase family 4 protein [Caulobacteraceae bacterium]|nr:glycosyltransferase family 4 protein [Caulobacter sp.]